MTWTHEDGGPHRRQITPGGLGLEAGRLARRRRPDRSRDHDGGRRRRAPLPPPPRARPRRPRASSSGSTHDPSPCSNGHPTSPAARCGPAGSASPPTARSTSCSATTPTGSTPTCRWRPAARSRATGRTTASSRCPTATSSPRTSAARCRTSRLAAEDREPCELVVLDPIDLEIVARLVLPEPSIARLSADGDDVYVVGDTSLLRVRWDGTRARARRRLRGHLPHARRADLRLGLRARRRRRLVPRRRRRRRGLRRHPAGPRPLDRPAPPRAGRPRRRPRSSMAEVCGRPGGLVANPPVVDEARGVVVGYDSGNGAMTAFDLDTLERPLAARPGPRQPPDPLRGQRRARHRRRRRRRRPRRRHRHRAGPRRRAAGHPVRRVPHTRLRPRLLRVHLHGHQPRVGRAASRPPEVSA